MADEPVVGAILAGGLARRMGGGDKGCRLVGGRPILQRVIDCLAPQVSRLVVSANGDAGRLSGFRLPVVADSLPGHPGTLAGILAGLDWAAANAPEAEWLVTVPADTPFLPPDLVARLQHARRSFAATLVCATSAARTHWVIGTWPVRLRHELRQAMDDDKVRSVAAFVGRYDTALVEWATVPVDPFHNINTPDDLALAERLAAARPQG